MRTSWNSLTGVMATQSADVTVSGESDPISPPGLGLATGRRRESVVWDYFVFDAGKGKSVCQVEVVSGAGSGQMTLLATI